VAVNPSGPLPAVADNPLVSVVVDSPLKSAVADNPLISVVVDSQATYKPD